MLTFFIDMLHWLQAHQLACPVKKYLHIDCPGCGMQRSFIALLQGDIVLSVQLHPVTIPLLLFLLYSILHLTIKFKNGNRMIVYGYLFVTILIVTNYIYKIVNNSIL